MIKKTGKTLIIGGCGYLGSRLFQYLSDKSYKVDTLDLEWFGNFINPRNIKKNYNSLSTDFLKKYDNIILLAGNSSIPMCDNKMLETFKNNVANFIQLLDKIKDQKFIYASSFRVYGNINKLGITEDYDGYIPLNYYDLTKKEIDYYARLSNKNYYGLRMGTVCGYSPNQRVDVIINKMVDSALTKKEIVMFNKIFYRPILGIEDFCRGIDAILKGENHSGIYNLASFNIKIGNMAKIVAKRCGGVKIVDTGVSLEKYNLSISTKKFEKTFKFVFKDFVESIVDSIIKNYPDTVKSIRV